VTVPELQKSLIPLWLAASVLVCQTWASGRRAAVASADACVTRERLTVQEFESVMRQVAEGWNEGNADKAAECFTDDALYSAPPSLPHRGRKALSEYFGGRRGRPHPMHMTWHHLLFDPSAQIGAGEYTFRYKVQTHGMVIVDLSHGRISKWREYEVESNLPWDRFVAESKF
jgi:hypothetical protein